MNEVVKRFFAQFSTRASRDITLPPSNTPTPGNPYPNYTEKVLQLDAMYRGSAEWGGDICANVIDVRAAFTVGGGVKPVIADGVKQGEADRELAWLRDFMQWNELNLEEPLNWAREAELEGRFCAILWPDSKSSQISVRFLPWVQHRYTVESDERDYAIYSAVRYKPNMSGNEVVLKKGEFVYRTFGGRTHTVNDPTPKVGHVIRHMEALDRAFVDWRAVNNLHGSPFPHIKVGNRNDVDSTVEKIKKTGWKVGKALVTDADVSMVGIPMGGVESIEKEIVRNVCVISGHSGVAAHFLGFPDLLNNRSTSDNLFEATTVSVRRERAIWAGFYEELFQSALTMNNNVFKTAFNPNLVSAALAEADRARLELLTSVWLPLHQGGALSLGSLLSRVPGVDPEAEARAIAEERVSRAQGLMDKFKVNSLEKHEDQA